MATNDHNRGEDLPDGGGVKLREGVTSLPSSPSEGSQTLQGDSASDANTSIHSPRVTSPISSPMDVNDFAAITRSDFWKAGGHFVHNNNTTPETSSPSMARDMGPMRPRHIQGQAYGGGANPFGGGGYRSSRTWVSPDAQHHQEFIIVRNSMRRLFKHSDVAKWKLHDYTAHKEAMLAAKKSALARALEQKELERALPAHQPQSQPTVLRDEAIIKLLNPSNLNMTGNSSRALGLKTIWCVDWHNGKDEFAPWPSIAEMKWEGDDRAKTACGRFLPLPREPGAPSIPWGQLQVIEQYPLDQVQCIPTMEDVYLPVDEIDDDVVPQLLNNNLVEMLDESL